MKITGAAFLYLLVSTPLLVKGQPYILSFQWLPELCLGEDSGLTNTNLSVIYSYLVGEYVQSVGNRLRLEKNRMNQTYEMDYNGLSDIVMITINFKQQEHGGGNCNCVLVRFNNNVTTEKQNIVNL